MKKIHALLIFLLIPLFLFTQKVEATTADITFSDDYSFYTNPNYSNLQSWIFEQSNPRYIIYQSYNDSSYHVRIFRFSDNTYTCSFSYGQLTCNTTVTTGDLRSTDYIINLSDYSTTFNTTYNASGFTLAYGTNYLTNNIYLIDTNLVFTSPSMWNDKVIITDGTYTNQCGPSVDCPWLSKGKFYTEYYYVPPPDDDTPLLTSFYETTIDRLSYLCDYIVNSYIYLAVFTIFILYFVILLIRRLR